MKLLCEFTTRPRTQNVSRGAQLRITSHILCHLYTTPADTAPFPSLIWKAFLDLASAFLCPWPLLGPHLFLFPCISSIFVSWCLQKLQSSTLLQPELRDRWETRPLTVITDPLPRHHLAPDLLSLGAEHGALFLWSQVQEVIMIPVHLGYRPWAQLKLLKSCLILLLGLTSHYTVADAQQLYLHTHTELTKATMSASFQLPNSKCLKDEQCSCVCDGHTFLTDQMLCLAKFAPLRDTCI